MRYAIMVLKCTNNPDHFMIWCTKREQWKFLVGQMRGTYHANVKFWEVPK